MSCAIKHIMLVLAKDKYVVVSQCSAAHRFITRPYEVMEKDAEG